MTQQPTTTLINFSGDFYLGEKVIISGDSGSGKTTLLKLIQGQILPTKGKIIRVDVHKNRPFISKYSKYTIPFFASDWYHEPHWTITTLMGIFSLTVPDIEAIGLLPRQTKQKLRDLSGGERVRLWLCCLMKQPTPILLLDEPTQALDDRHVALIISMIQAYPGLVFMATHDRRLFHLADQHYHLNNENRLECIKDHPRVRKIDNVFPRRRLNLASITTLGFRDRYLPWTTLSQLLSLFALVSMTVINIFGQYYQSYLTQFYREDTWMVISEKVVTPLAQSPFNLVEYRLPKLADLQKTFSLLQPLTIDTNYLALFPKLMRFHDVQYEVHIANLPFIKGRLSMVVVSDRFVTNQDYIWHFDVYDDLGQTVDTVSQTWPLDVQLIKRLTVLETPRIYLSYQQLKSLAMQTTLAHPFFTGMSLEQYLKTYSQDYTLLIDTHEPSKKATLEKLGQSLSQYELRPQTMMLQQWSDAWFNLIHWFSLFFAMAAMIFLKLNHHIFVSEIIEKKDNLISTFQNIGLQSGKIKQWLLQPFQLVKLGLWLCILLMAIVVKKNILAMLILPLPIFYLILWLLFSFDLMSDWMIALNRMGVS